MTITEFSNNRERSFGCETKQTHLVKLTSDNDTFLHSEIYRNIQTGLAVFLQILG